MNKAKFIALIESSPMLSEQKKQEIVSQIDQLSARQLADIAVMLYMVESSVLRESKKLLTTLQKNTETVNAQGSKS